MDVLGSFLCLRAGAGVPLLSSMQQVFPLDGLFINLNNIYSESNKHFLIMAHCRIIIVLYFHFTVKKIKVPEDPDRVMIPKFSKVFES